MIKKYISLMIAFHILAIPLFVQEKWTDPDQIFLERAKALLKAVPLIEGHNDLSSSILEASNGDPDKIDLAQRQPQLSADIPRLREGLVGAQFWAVWVPSEYRHQGKALRGCLESIDLIHRFVCRYPDLEFAYTADDIERIYREGKIASVLAVEGGYMIENSLPVLRLFYKLGVRYMTLTHMRTISWVDSATDFPRHGGLTEFGEEVVKEMNKLGMFIDLTHVSPEAAKDALRISRAPVIFSHSNALAVNPHPRNVPDDVLRLLAENGGVIMVNFISKYNPPTAAEWQKIAQQFPSKANLLAMRAANAEPVWSFRYEMFADRLRSEIDDKQEIRRRLQKWMAENPKPRGTLSDVADHIDHIRKVAGIDHIGIGSDFFDSGESSMAYGLQDVTRYPYLFAELLRRGYSDEDIKKIAGLNFLRAMRQMEQVAEKLP